MSVKWRILRDAASGDVVLARVRLCESFWCHFRGLQLVPHLPDDEGLLFVTKREGRSHTTIHMLFMRFSIGVLWLDANGVVVDKKLAKPWRLAYAPVAPAQYFLEANPDILDRVQVGDQLRFDEIVE
ncbi:MAG: hypothetical protein D6737_19725 [Chloroflexi bacterium]|nr:MAG: hypothetical protein CUN54_04300 [Phototrophicales bacterium]RMF76677.1 MAG: hypothetical protein D6737_19725 [Chloroflexota bacterium]